MISLYEGHRFESNHNRRLWFHFGLFGWCKAIPKNHMETYMKLISAPKKQGWLIELFTCRLIYLFSLHQIPGFTWVAFSTFSHMLCNYRSPCWLDHLSVSLSKITLPLGSGYGTTWGKLYVTHILFPVFQSPLKDSNWPF